MASSTKVGVAPQRPTAETLKCSIAMLGHQRFFCWNGRKEVRIAFPLFPCVVPSDADWAFLVNGRWGPPPLAEHSWQQGYLSSLTSSKPLGGQRVLQRTERAGRVDTIIQAFFLHLQLAELRQW